MVEGQLLMADDGWLLMMSSGFSSFSWYLWSWQSVQATRSDIYQLVIDRNLERCCEGQQTTDQLHSGKHLL